MSKRVLLIIILFLSISSFGIGAEYPNKPITILVHTKPGGAVDLMARTLSRVADNYCDQPLVVVNKPGGGGIIAGARLLSSKADGYTILAFPATFIPTLQTTDIGIGLDDLKYLACLTISPEAIITNPNSEINSLEKIISHAKANPGTQKWCGPGTGSLDHLMAVKFWEKADIKVKWIPYGGGSQAMGAVMGKHADVYVGNPEDILGRQKNLNIVGVSTEKRLDAFPEVPTLIEKGIDLPNEVMWRGFVVHKNTNDEITKYLVDLFEKCSKDSIWQNYINRTMVTPVFMKNEKFKELVYNDVESSRKYLKIAGFELDKNANEAPYLTLFLFGIFIISFLIVYLVFKKKDIKINGTISILTITGILSVTFFYISSFFPAPREGLFVSSATVPKVWSIFLFIVSVIGLKLYYKNPTDETAKKGENVKSVISLSFLILAYITLISIIGFFISTGLFLISSMLIMRYKKYISLLLTTTLVLLFMYIVFIKILMVPLPIGSIF
ncbi:MAG: tripartite tricarboxylate transporter substrate-binding protein [Candidatus Marinimicrobia bacterium]|nr:tripartite tricarboxylate transporter substrate-binding protein [Candidatus Neomarinimicrobiota bacterium]